MAKPARKDFVVSRLTGGSGKGFAVLWVLFRDGKHVPGPGMGFRFKYEAVAKAKKLAKQAGVAGWVQQGNSYVRCWNPATRH